MLRGTPRVGLLWGLCGLSFVVQMCTHLPNPETPKDSLAAAATWVERFPPERTLVVAYPPDMAFSILEAMPAEYDVTETVPTRPHEQRRYENVLVVAYPDSPDPPELEFAWRVESVRWERLEGRRFRWPDPPGEDGRVIFDLLPRIRDAQVSLEGPYGVPCEEEHESGGLHCRGRPPWNYVGPVELSVEGTSWSSLWAHPVTDHGLVIETPEVDLGTHVVFEAAFSDAAAATQNGTPVKIVLDIPGVASRTLSRSNRRGVLRIELPTNSPNAPDRGRIKVSLSTPNDGRRHLGINLRVVNREEATP